MVVELPEELACYRWGTPYRPHPPLYLAPGQQGLAPVHSELAPAQRFDAEPGSQPELLTPGSRRMLDVVDLALDGGWLAVLHEIGGSDPALWLLVEAVVDAPRAGGLAEGWWVVAWVDLASGPPPRVAARWLSEPSGQVALPLLAGLPSTPPERRPIKLRAALEAGCSALYSLLARHPETAVWLRRRGARLQLYLTMAALVYLHPGRPWPPPARLAVEAAPSAGAGGAGIAPDPPAAAERGGAAALKERRRARARHPR